MSRHQNLSSNLTPLSHSSCLLAQKKKSKDQWFPTLFDHTTLLHCPSCYFVSQPVRACFAVDKCFSTITLLALHKILKANVLECWNVLRLPSPQAACIQTPIYNPYVASETWNDEHQTIKQTTSWNTKRKLEQAEQRGDTTGVKAKRKRGKVVFPLNCKSDSNRDEAGPCQRANNCGSWRWFWRNVSFTGLAASLANDRTKGVSLARIR